MSGSVASRARVGGDKPVSTVTTEKTVTRADLTLLMLYNVEPLTILHEQHLHALQFISV